MSDIGQGFTPFGPNTRYNRVPVVSGPYAGGEWHIYPGGRRVLVKPAAPAAGVSGAAPEAPAPAAPAPVDWRLDPTYLGQIAQNQATEEQTIGGLTGQRQRTLAGYGYSGQFDPSGKLTGALQFDPTDPYSKAALLKRNYENQRRVTGRGMAARGQLYAGAAQSAQDVVTRNQAIREDELTKSLLDYLEGVSTKIGEARTTRGQADINAGIGAAGRAATSAY
jgi:hypothetical protein